MPQTKKTTKATTPKTVAPAAKAVHHRSFVGQVVRAKTAKTIAVQVERKTMHKKYRKQQTKTEVYLVHDEKAEAKVGDKVNFVECRPISKLKRWRLVNVIK